MKKTILSTLTIISLSSLTTNIVNNNVNNKTNQGISIVKNIAQEFESNPNKKINYDSLFKIINETSFFSELNKNINIFNGKQLANKYGYPDSNDDNYFIYDNNTYNININKQKEQWDSFINVFSYNIIRSFSHTVKYPLVVSIISELAHYYSINNNPSKIFDSLNILKELIQDLNADFIINKSRNFMTKIQSWNLNSIIDDYDNKKFNNAIDKYRNINYNNLVSLTDFDFQLINEINSIHIDWKDNGVDWSRRFWSWNGKGTNTTNQNIILKNKNDGQPIFDISYQENLNINLNRIIDIEEHYLKNTYTTTHLQFSDLTKLDINPIF